MASERPTVSERRICTFHAAFDNHYPYLKDDEASVYVVLWAKADTDLVCGLSSDEIGAFAGVAAADVPIALDGLESERLIRRVARLGSSQAIQLLDPPDKSTRRKRVKRD